MYIIQTPIDLGAAQAAVNVPKVARRDLGLILKTLLTESLGGPVIRPWRLLPGQGRARLLVGYAAEDAEAIRRRLSMALPMQQAAFGEVYAAAVPTLGDGQEVTLHVKAAPVVSARNDDGSAAERDAYLRLKERAEAGRLSAPVGPRVEGGEPVPTREDAYRIWASERLSGFEVTAFSLRGFQLVDHIRQIRRPKPNRVPEAEMLIGATVRDAEVAMSTVLTGIGDRKAYGCGMIRVAPASAARFAP